MISGVFTTLAFIGFLGVTGWAFSRRNRERFEEASRLPLTDDALPDARTAAVAPCCAREKQS
jgi:cytochrome c oxidase cbb3-type subunit 4